MKKYGRKRLVIVHEQADKSSSLFMIRQMRPFLTVWKDVQMGDTLVC